VVGEVCNHIKIFVAGGFCFSIRETERGKTAQAQEKRDSDGDPASQREAIGAFQTSQDIAGEYSLSISPFRICAFLTNTSIHVLANRLFTISLFFTFSPTCTRIILE